MLDAEKSDAEVRAPEVNNNTVVSASDININKNNTVVSAPGVDNNNNNKRTKITLPSEAKIVTLATTLTEENSSSPISTPAAIFGGTDKESAADTLSPEGSVLELPLRPQQTIDKPFNDHTNRLTSPELEFSSDLSFSSSASSPKPLSFSLLKRGSSGCVRSMAGSRA